MLFAGIAWTGDGFVVALVDDTGAAVGSDERFPAGALDALWARMSSLDEQTGHDLVCVVDSTQGMVDGGLMRRGVRVHRADPAMLPERPPFGSVDATTLARTGVRRLTELPRLRLTEGSLTGRAFEDDESSAAEDCLSALTTEGRCVSRLNAPEGRKVVALTFDDGPNPPCTTQVLDILDDYGVPATFFCVGLHAHGHREALERMAAAGHAIGNHTWSHPLLSDLSLQEVAAQVERTDEAIGQATAGRPILFRPPYGAGRAEIFAFLGRDRSKRIVMWDVDTEDWAMPGSEAIATRVLDRAGPGSIVLMHDGGGDRSQTVAALPVIIEGLLGRGFSFVRVD